MPSARGSRRAAARSARSLGAGRPRHQPVPRSTACRRSPKRSRDSSARRTACVFACRYSSQPSRCMPATVRGLRGVGDHHVRTALIASGTRGARNAAATKPRPGSRIAPVRSATSPHTSHAESTHRLRGARLLVRMSDALRDVGEAVQDAHALRRPERQVNPATRTRRADRGENLEGRVTAVEQSRSFRTSPVSPRVAAPVPIPTTPRPHPRRRSSPSARPARPDRCRARPQAGGRLRWSIILPQATEKARLRPWDHVECSRIIQQHGSAETEHHG